MPGEFTLDDAVAYINETPALASLLYDADMMPEQCISGISKFRLRLICLHWQRRELEHAEAIHALNLKIQDQRAAASGASSTQATPTDISAAALPHQTGE